MNYKQLSIIALTLALFSACSNAPTTGSATAKSTDSATVEAPPQRVADTTSAKIGPTKIDTLLHNVFLALKHQSSDEYMKLTPSRKEIEQVFLSMTPPDKKEMVKQKLQEEDPSKEERQMSLDAFKNTVKRGDELKINWSALVYKGITIDSITADGMKTYKGELAFNEGVRCFHMKYDDCLKIGKKYVITNVYTPYEDSTYLNQEKSLKYKAAYIRNCVAMMKKHPDPILMGNSKSPEQYCTCSYEQLAKETSCEELLKDTVHMQMRNCPK